MTTTAMNVAGNINFTGTLSNYLNTGRNLFHNGSFIIAQRGFGPFVLANAITTQYQSDRWFTEFFGGSATVNINTATATDRTQIGDETAIYYPSIQFIGSSLQSAYTIFGQRLEGLWQYGNKTITVSFWAKSGNNGTNVAVTYTSIANGGTPVQTLPTANATVITLSTTWQRYQTTFTTPSMTNQIYGSGDNYFEIQFWLTAGSSIAPSYKMPTFTQADTVSFWGMQAEFAPYATPFEHLEQQIHGDNCFRYYQADHQIYYYFIVVGSGSGVGSMV